MSMPWLPKVDIMIRKALPDNRLTLDQDYLDEFTELYNNDNPGHTLTAADLYFLADLIMRAVQVRYRQIPKEKEAEYLKAVAYVKRQQRQS